MPDRTAGPAQDLLVMERELAISQQEHNIKAMQFRRAQLMAEVAQIDTNIEAAEASISDTQVEIAAMKKGATSG
jgi:septal ring factor EnvC (AmiA/AmiB activator)